MTESEYEPKYDPLSYHAEGGQERDALIAVLEALVSTIKKSHGSFFRFKINIEEK